MEEPKEASPQFEWGKKRGVGGAKKDVQFYDSFTFDGVHYSLYDCVYTYKTGEPDPYIGKIVKIWEQSGGKKRVKLLWFFHPSEIVNYLGDAQPLDNELFLASGEGAGLANINTLESISAKCSVICTSEDARNPQPSKDAVEGADYIFYRTFDVGRFIISDKLPDKIAGIEVKSLLNRKEDLVRSPFPESEVDGSDMKGKAEAGTGSHTLSSSKTLKSEDNKGKIDEPGHATVSSKDNFVEKKHQNEAKRYQGGNNDPKSKVESSRDAGKANNSVALCVDEKVTSAKHKTESDTCNDKPSKKMRLSDGSTEADDLQRDKHSADAEKVVIKPDKDDSHKGSIQLYKNSEKLKLIEKNVKSSDESLQEATPVSAKNDTKAEHQILDVTRKPDADRSKWFKTIPWDARVQKANEQGTLVLLQNFNRSLTSRDIEDVIYYAFKQSVTAKIIPLLPPYQNPHYGQAYVIFKTRDAADAAVRKINTEHLMLSNGSPFIASKGMLEIPPKATTFVGHLEIKRVKMMQREEMRKAVSTSHCSQPNTIEYEMAMDWIYLHEKTVNSFNRLYKGQRDERKKVMKDLKTK